MFQARKRPITAMSKITIGHQNVKNLPLAEISEENISKSKRTRLTSAKSSRHMPIYSQLAATRTVKGKSPDFLQSRKQSLLNSCFNKRKNELLKITQENRRIYERINSQQSNYSTKKTNKSIDSNCAKSKISASSSCKHQKSRNLTRSNSVAKSAKRRIFRQKKDLNEQPIIQEKSVNKIGQEDAMKFKRMFFNDFNEQTPMSSVSLPMRQQKMAKKQKLMKKNSRKENIQVIGESDPIKKSFRQKKTKRLSLKNMKNGYDPFENRKKNLFVAVGVGNQSRNDKLTKILSEMGFKYHYC